MRQQFFDYIKDDKTVLIIASQPLDLDSIGSGLVLKKYLESLGKIVTLVFPRNFSEFEKNQFNYLPFFNEIQDKDTRKFFTSKQFDNLIFIDGTSLTQYYDSEHDRANPPDINIYEKRVHIDHHLKLVDSLGKLIIHDPNLGSTMELILAQIVPLDFFDKDTATLAYAAISGDTGNFQYAFSSQTLKLAGELMEKGADVELIIQKMFYDKPKDYFNKYCWVISQVEFNQQVRSTFLKLSLKLIKEQQFNRDQVDLVKDIYKEEIAKSVNGYDRGVIIEEKESGRIKVSARGNTQNKISFPEAFAQVEGAKGGGHFNAAGFEIEGKTIDLVQEQIVKVFEKLLKSA